MTYDKVIEVCERHLIPQASELYGLSGYTFSLIERDCLPVNIVYSCEKEDATSKIFRVGFRGDKNNYDYLSETEFIRYLHENGGAVANVIDSKNGNLFEEIIYDSNVYFICVFEKAKGQSLVENDYQYRKGAPITEYYYACGKVLGKLHQLSKSYTPIYRRENYLEAFPAEDFDALIPDSLSLCKQKIFALLKTLGETDQGHDVYGMIHGDFNSENYNIDSETGQITVFDFDNCCFGWYMLDLANLWIHGMDWVDEEPNADVRKQHMDSFFKAVIAGYRTETALDDATLLTLPLFLQATLALEILAAFEDMRDSGEEPECDEELSYLTKCLENDIPYWGFFDEIYSREAPFK